MRGGRNPLIVNYITIGVVKGGLSVCKRWHIAG